jgi:hypothetical protein
VGFKAQRDGPDGAVVALSLGAFNALTSNGNRLVAVTAFVFVYAWSCMRTKWSLSLLLAWSAFA